MNIRNYTLLFFFISIIKLSGSQTIIEPSPVTWYSVKEADSLFKKNPKPLLIDVYTDWCGWCKHMMKTTFAHAGIASYINTNFYPVRFDAEGFDTIFYEGKAYVNNGIGNKPKHEFANYIMKGRFSFPTIVYIDKKRNMYQIPGYMKVKEIEPLLVYFAEEINYSAQYNQWEILFQFNYFKNYKEEINKSDKSLYPDTLGRIKWYNFKEASELSLENKKPLFVYFYSDWCNSCKITDGIVLKNSIISKIINDNFYPVKFNAANQEKHILYGQGFEGTGINNPHKLTYALLQKSFKFPAYVLIASKTQKMDEIHGFLLPDQLESILSYFSENNYKNKKYNDFLKTFKSQINK